MDHPFLVIKSISMIVSNGKKKRKKVGIEDELNSEKCRDEVEKRSAFLSLSLSLFESNITSSITKKIKIVKIRI